jgi:hypothetical protein
MIRKLKSGEYRLYSRKVNPRTGRRRNLGTFATRAAAEKHERAVQYFKRSRYPQAPASAGTRGVPAAAPAPHPARVRARPQRIRA